MDGSAWSEDTFPVQKTLITPSGTTSKDGRTEGKRIRKWYSVQEVRELVEEYEAFRERQENKWVLVRLIDLHRAYAHLPSRYKEAVLLTGMIGLPVRECERLLNVDYSTVHRRYLRGLEAMVVYLNGGK
jgi:DNA-directed RNA polymerase specialized sigma24 family protein